jgi:triacylglycerol lipase
VILDADAARSGLLVRYAEDMSGAALFAPADPRLSVEWNLLGHLISTDVVGSIETQVCYGYLAESKAAPGTFIAVIRGTAGVLEWIEDAEFTLRPYASGGVSGGNVEDGFWGIYERMQYCKLGTTALTPVAASIAAAVGDGSVKVIGHSLGSAIATYLTLDLAFLVGDRVSGCFLASPRPGDDAFGALFHEKVKDYRVLNYELDLVPRVPRGFHFSDLPGATTISPDSAEARIKFGLGCNHHVICYISMLDYTLRSLIDGKLYPDEIICILGPRAAPPLQLPKEETS